MQRRTLLRSALAAFVAEPFARLRARAQDVPLSAGEIELLTEIAAIVLPSALGRRGAAEAAEQFVGWIRNYRPGADLGHGYGSTRLRVASARPGANYAAQLRAIERDAASRGGPFATRPAEARRAVVESALAGAGIQRLTARPSGAHVVADLMGFYFYSSAAQDLCYGAAIERDACRGLPGSDRPPRAGQ
jgi:hypothetical protein